MCFSSPKPPKPTPPPMPEQKAEPLGNEALDQKRRVKNQATKARKGLKIPIGSGGSTGGLGIPRG
jgi:hypothetical protein